MFTKLLPGRNEDCIFGQNYTKKIIIVDLVIILGNFECALVADVSVLRSLVMVMRPGVLMAVSRAKQQKGKKTTASSRGALNLPR